MLARKPSTPRLAATPDPDILSLSETLYSLQTASSVTLHSQGTPPCPHSTLQLIRSRSTQNARTRLVWIESILASADILTPQESRWIYQELIEIQRSELVDEATQDACWSVVLKQMYRGHIDCLAGALAAGSVHDIRAFFDDLAIRRPNWGQYLGQPSRPTATWSPGKYRFAKTRNVEEVVLEGSRALLLEVACTRRHTLDLDGAFTLFTLDPVLLPLALLFDRPPKPASGAFNLPLFFTFLTHLDYSPSFAAIPPHQAAYAPAVVGAVTLLTRASTSDPASTDLVVLVAHILTAIQPLACGDPLAPDIVHLRAIFPWLPPHAPRKYLARHPASPFLSFAIFLVDRSAAAARLLLEGGLVRTLEALYDQDFPDPRVRADDPYVQTRDELYKLCLRLLVAVARHCDLRDCVLMEELKADVRRCSRQLSEQYFGVFWVE